MIDETPKLTRRELIRTVSLMLGGTALVGGSRLVAALEAESEPTIDLPEGFTQEKIDLLDLVADTILPETDTPGASAAGVGPFIALMVADTYSPDERAHFHRGLKLFEARCEALLGGPFAEADVQQRTAFLTDLDEEQHYFMEHRDKGQDTHYFRMIKELTLLGYFTSEIGYTQAMRYREAPGRFDPCIPHEEGETIWARHA